MSRRDPARWPIGRRVRPIGHSVFAQSVGDIRGMAKWFDVCRCRADSSLSM